MTDDGEGSDPQATVRERLSEPKVKRLTRDEPATVRMDSADRPLEPRWPGQNHRRGDLLGRYVVLSLLGSGGMGEVYSAYDPALDRRIALKVIKPFADQGSVASARSLLLTEAQALARLAHPNVVTVYDVGTLDDHVYVAMEYVEGITLATWLQSPHTWSEIVGMFAEAGRGLEAAHAAGIVHRDFKPDNVIIGKDGRVRVIDFGIALVRKPRANAGELVGTPAFMAPEQFEAGDVGPAADQFAFCVALYAALWKQHAFAGDSDLELRDNVCAGRLTPPPESAVPPSVRDAVVRALARDPAARHPSMAALIAAIRPPPRRKLVPYAIAGVAMLLAATALLFTLSGGDEPKPCTGFEDDLAGVWGPARKTTTRARVPEEDWPGVERVFDTYAAEWVAHKIAACRATSVTREQTAAVLERRMACLDTRQRELDAAVAIIAAGGVSSNKAFEIAGGLRSVSGCANLAALAPIPPGAPPSEINAIEDGLGRIRALRHGADYKEARALAAKILAHARRISWGSAEARALVERGLTESADGDPKASRESLFEAIRRGQGAADAASQAAAWIALVSVEAGGLREPTEALRWAKHAEVALAQAGGDQEQHGQLLHNIAAALRILDRNEEALDHERRALALFEHAFGPRHVRVANQRSSVATTLRRLDKLDESIREGEASLALVEQLVGGRHPYVASVLNNLGLAYDEANRLDDARRVLERALAIRQQELGMQHGGNANPLMNLASLERRAGRFDVAETLWQRAYDIRVATLGENHPDVARALHGKLLDRTGRGLDDEARALASEVIARHRARKDPVELAAALSQRCELERRAGKLEAATDTCNEAIAALGSTPDPNRALFVFAYAARVAAQRKLLSDANEWLDKGRTALASATRDKAVGRGYVGWAAAHVALVAGRRDEAIALAKEARDSLLSHGLNFTYIVDDLDRLK